jgi:DNA-binding response OmpR family regulator/two-component sensor histidine kinase
MERIKDEKNKDELKIAHKNANKLLGLVNQLLDISKIESGNMKLRTNPTNYIQLLKALTLSLASYAERKRITLKFNSTEDEIILYLDRDKIEKIITNILSNAFKFTPEGGRIEVALVKEDKYVNTIISDTGIGIPKEKVSKIFDRFYQVDGSHTREQEGTGIGLALTKELVDLHKGKIEVESEESKGTTFTVSIPLGKEHLKPEEIDETEKIYEPEKESFITDIVEEKKGIQKDTIEFLEKESLPLLLIVEDNSDVRKYIKDNLVAEFRVLEAVDGEDGWYKSIEQMPDLIISDVMMPKLDGFKLCDKFKTDERTSHIPVILLTAKAAKEDKLAGYETGADEYLMKPFEPDELRARISNLIEQRKRLHQHFQKKGMFESEQTNITSIDKKFLQRVIEIIKANISNTEFNVEMLTEQIAVSRSLLNKKVVSLTGEPPKDLIKRIRLTKAVELIEKKFGNLSEIALEVGFDNPAYFSECFKKQFGVPPSKYQSSE